MDAADHNRSPLPEKKVERTAHMLEEREKSGMGSIDFRGATTRDARLIDNVYMTRLQSRPRRTAASLSDEIVLQ